MLTTLSIALCLAAAPHLALPPTAPVLAQAQAPRRETKEKARDGIWKLVLLMLITGVLLIGGAYGIHKLREYLKDADIIK